MGSQYDSMHSYVERDLKKMFLAQEGYQIEKNPAWGDISFDYQVFKKRFGKKENYPVDIIIDTKVSQQAVEEMNAKIAALQEKGVSMAAPVLFVPTGADISAVPEEYCVNELKVLKVEDNDVIWWKKTFSA
jgi:hypothetical protein